MRKPVSFLLVDDDLDDTAIFKEVLEEINNSVTFQSALNGFEAMNLLRNKANDLPDMIFLDLNMPGMDGKQCLEELKTDERLRFIPVIIYTTSSHSMDIEETIQKGATCFITKPSNMKELKNILSYIADNIHNNLEAGLRSLSNRVSSFIVC